MRRMISQYINQTLLDKNLESRDEIDQQTADVPCSNSQSPTLCAIYSFRDRRRIHILLFVNRVHVTFKLPSLRIHFIKHSLPSDI